MHDPAIASRSIRRENWGVKKESTTLTIVG